MQQSELSSRAPSDALRPVELIPGMLTLFSVLQHLETAVWPSGVSAAGLAVSVLQPAAFAVNRNWKWGGIVARASDALYVVLIPFWDTTHPASWGAPAGLFVFWVVILLVILSAASAGVFVKDATEVLSRQSALALKALLHMITGVLFMPVLLLLLSAAVCDRDGEALWQSPSVACRGNIHVLHVVACAGAVPVLFALTLGVRTMIHSVSPFSLHRLARPHSNLDFWCVLYETATPALYVTLLSSGKPQLFACLHCVSSASVGMSFACVLPYYDSGTTIVKVTGYFAAAFLSAYAASPSAEVSHRDADVVLIGVGVLFCWVLAVVLVKRMRVPAAYLKAACLFKANGLRSAGGAGLPQYTVKADPQYPPLGLRGQDGLDGQSSHSSPLLPPQVVALPARLPSFAEGYSRHMNLEQHLLNTPVPHGGTSAGPPESVPAVFMLSAIFMDTDIEASTRFVREYCFELEAGPPPAMAAYYARIYVSGLKKFPRSELLQMHLAMYLHYYCAEPSIALAELRCVQSAGHSIPISYRAYRLSVELKSMLNIRDNSHHKVLIKARSLHVQALQLMTSFWAKLLSESFDSLDLAFLATSITEKRSEGLQAFESAISVHTDKGVHLRYALFLEQVMLDEAGAQAVRSIIKDLGEGSIRSGESRTVLATTQKGKKSKQQRSNRITALDRKIKLLFLLFLAIILGFGVYTFLDVRSKTDFIANMHAAGELRTLAQYCAYLALALIKSATEEKAADIGCSTIECTSTGLSYTDDDCATSQVFPSTLILQSKLKDATSQFRQRFNELTHGEFEAQYDPLIKLFAAPSFELQLFLSATVSTRDLFSVWEMCSKLLAALETLGVTNPPCLVEGAAQSFIRENTFRRIAPALNTTLVLYEEEFSGKLDQGIVVTSVLLGTALCLAFFVYLMLELSFLVIASAKMDTLNLFSMIPKNTLLDIHADSKRRLSRFEVASTNEELGLEDSVAEDMDDDRCEDLEASGTAFKQFSLRNVAKMDGKVIKHNLPEKKDKEEKEADIIELQQLVADEDDFSPPPVAASSKNLVLFARLATAALGVCCCVLVIVLREEVTSYVSDASKTFDKLERRGKLVQEVSWPLDDADDYVFTCGMEAFAEYERATASGSFERLVGGLIRESPAGDAKVLLRVSQTMSGVRERAGELFRLARPVCKRLGKDFAWQDPFFGGAGPPAAPDLLAARLLAVRAAASTAFFASRDSLLTNLRDLPSRPPNPAVSRVLIKCHLVLSLLLSFALFFLPTDLETDSAAAASKPCKSSLFKYLRYPFRLSSAVCVVIFFGLLAVDQQVHQVDELILNYEETVRDVSLANQNARTPRLKAALAAADADFARVDDYFAWFAD
eukprot:gene6104-9376_t